MNSAAISPLGSGVSPATLATDTVRTARTRAFNAAALRDAAPTEQRAAVSAQFEAVLVRQLLGPTMKSMLGGAGSEVAGSIYGDLLADTISQQLTAGPGLGLGRFLEQQLAPKGPTAANPDAATS